MKQEQPYHARKHCLLFECVFWMYHLLIIALALFILSQVVYTFQDVNTVKQLSDYPYSLETIQNWKKGYIIDIRVVSTNNCPESYTPMINFTFEGTDEGCYCAAFVDYHNFQYVLPGICTTQLIDLGCIKIQAVGQLPLQMWKGSKLLCIKRATSLNFYSSTNTTTLTGSMMKECASGLKYQVNTLSNLDCPVSNIANTSIDSTQKNLQLDSANSMFINFVSRKAYPIADFKLSEYQFCPFFDQINISPNKNGNYKLAIVNRTEPCNGTDSRMNTFDQMNEGNFLTSNTRVYQRISALPGYPRPSDRYIYKLGYISYADWTYECRVSSTHSLNQATKHLTFEDRIFNMRVMMIVAGFFVAIIILLIRTFYIVRHIIELKTKAKYNCLLMTQQQVTQQIPTLNIKKSFSKEFCLFIFQIFMRIALLFSLMYGMFSLMDESIWLKGVFDMDCTNTFMNNIFRKYQAQVDLGSQRLVYTQVIWLVVIACDIFYFWVRNYIGDLKTKQTQKVQQEDSAKQIVVDKDLAQFKHQEDGSLAVLKIEQKDNQDGVYGTYDIDNFMADRDGFGETKGNFQFDRQQNNQLVVKKKKKKGKKRKNLFKDDDI